MKFNDTAWCGLARVPIPVHQAKDLPKNGPFLEDLESWSVVCLSYSSHSVGATGVGDLDIPSVVLQVVRPPVAENEEFRQLDGSIEIHPFLFDYLTQIAGLYDGSEQELHQSLGCVALDDSAGLSAKDCVSILPVCAPYNTCLDYSGRIATKQRMWSLRKLRQQKDLPVGVELNVCIVFADNPELFGLLSSSYTQEQPGRATMLECKRALHHSLQGRYIQKDSVSLLCLSEGEDLVLIRVMGWSTGGEMGEPSCVTKEGMDPDIAYRIGSCEFFSINVVGRDTVEDAERLLLPDKASPQRLFGSPCAPNKVSFVCPGYESTVDLILQLLQGPVTTALPTGLLLTGCSGIGKSRVIARVASKLEGEMSYFVRIVSMQDMLLRASSLDQKLLLNWILPPSRDTLEKSVVIFDDLIVLNTEDQSGGRDNVDAERLLVLNALLQAVDTLVAHNAKLVGIAQDPSKLPAEVIKVTRFEKEVPMSPPSQSCREEILSYYFLQMGCDRQRTGKWADLISRITPGFVAADLRQLCINAWARAQARTINSDFGSGVVSWGDLREAATEVVPSQLATLDVTKPSKTMEDPENMENWIQVHQQAWKRFAGYEIVKRRVFRGVVAPWRRHLEDKNKSATTFPPSGVLFHGPSGTGKSLAAQCLGSSIGLPMIKVRTADILNKWLGGSEAAIRSVFSRARAASPCILFFDEIDAIAVNREDGEDSSTGVISRMLSTLLNEMQGISSNNSDDILVVACTNRPEHLDAALLRPGRLEEHVELGLPDKEDIAAILELCLTRAKVGEDVDVSEVASILKDRQLSAADVCGLAREGVLRAIRRCSGTDDDVVVTMRDITRDQP